MRRNTSLAVIVRGLTAAAEAQELFGLGGSRVFSENSHDTDVFLLGAGYRF